MKSNVNPRTVALVARLSMASGRHIATGVIRAAHRFRWELKLADTAESDYAENLAARVQSGCAGMIVANLTEDVLRLIRRATFPVVVIGTPDAQLKHRKAPVLYVRNDDEGVGAAGARFLTGLGAFGTYAFVTADHPKSYCAAARERGFVRALSESGHACTVQAIEANDDEATAREKLGAMLEAMAKPAAVMAYTDQLALKILEAARLRHIAVPQQLSVIGVDNDELLCELATPTLTSVEPDHVIEGELAGRVLNALMRKTRPPAEEKRINRGLRMVERDSARPIPPALHLVHAAQVFIAENFMKPIGVAEIVAHLKVSRRLADLRYRAGTGESFYQTLTRLRLNAVRERLTSTSLPLAKIVAQSGLTDLNSAARLFKKHFHTTMGAYRATHATAAP